MQELAYPTNGNTAAFIGFARERWGWEPIAVNDPPLWLGNTVRLRPPVTHADFIPLVDPTHNLLLWAEEILQAWPVMYQQCQYLLDEIISGMSSKRAITMAAVGGTCGPGDGWGKIMVIANNPVGYAEGVVHEVGHHKLRALGIDMETHDGRFLQNKPEELYESGVRKDKLRPMSAVLHAHYSYLHVSECELRAESALGYDIRQMAPYQVTRLTEGLATIRKSARWTREGKALRDQIERWTVDVLRGLDAPRRVEVLT